MPSATTRPASTDQNRRSTVAVPFNDSALAIAVDPSNADKLQQPISPVRRFAATTPGFTGRTSPTTCSSSKATEFSRIRERAGEVYRRRRILRTRMAARAGHRGTRVSDPHACSRFSANSARDRIYLSVPSAGGVHFLQGGTDAVGRVSTAALQRQTRADHRLPPVFPAPCTRPRSGGTPGRLYARISERCREIDSDGSNTWQPLNYPTGGNGISSRRSRAPPRRAEHYLRRAAPSDVMRSHRRRRSWTNVGRRPAAQVRVVPIVVSAASDPSFVYGAPVVPILQGLCSQLSPRSAPLERDGAALGSASSGMGKCPGRRSGRASNRSSSHWPQRLRAS